MLLKQMQYFVSIVDRHSFTEAAAEHFISQSAISQAMSALEGDLGVKLIERKNRSFTLTAAGEYFYRKCRTLLAELKSARAETVRLGSGGAGSLRIGYISLYAGPELTEAIAEFSSAYPEIGIAVRAGTHEELYRGLVDGSLDIVLNDQRRAFSDDYVNMELRSVECMIEISKKHPLSTQSRLEMDELSGFSCILVSAQDERASEADFYQNILGYAGDFLYADTLDQARLMVVGNRGFLPVQSPGRLPAPTDTVVRIPLYRRNRRVTRKYCLFWQVDRSEYYIKAFADMLHRRLS